MSYLQTTASDYKSLMSVIRAFAVNTDGWASSYDDIVGSGQFGISKGNCFLSMGEYTSEPTPMLVDDEVNGGQLDEVRLNMVVNHSLNAANHAYWGHPGGTNPNIVTSVSDPDRVRQNDLYGPFVNVWLMSNSAKTYIWVVTQQGGDRFNTFGFGVLDKKGMTHPNVGFCAGNYMVWWPDDPDYSNSYAEFNYPSGYAHVLGLLAEGNLMCFLPDGVVDPALGFTDNAFQTKSFLQIMTRGWTDTDHQGGGSGRQLDYFLTVNNQETTGGVPLSALSIFYVQNNLTVYLGDFPNIRLVNMSDFTPGQEISFGAELWKVFPFKRKGTRANSNKGGSPLPYANSIEYGYAIKKVT